jgi:RNA polymerase sigma factor (sigma-70 family)
VEASAIPASVGLTRTRIAIGASLLRIRSDEQLVTLFRDGNDEAFRVIHDRYRARMFAYARQMLGACGQDPEDAVQEIFMRAYYGLRTSHRQLALRAWLYRIAHNRCIDDLRRPQPVIMIATETTAAGAQDPAVRIEQRDALRRLIRDVQRLPGHQRSALLMRELSGMSYAEVSGALGVSVPAVKSLLVRARVGLAQASEARNTACADIRADLILAHDRGVRTSGLARRHLRDCQGCREFRSEVRGVSRQLAALAPTLGPIGVLANLLGWGGGGAASGSGAVAGGAAIGSGAVAGGGAATSAGLLAGGAGHVVTLLAAAVVTAGGAVEIERTVSKVAEHHAHRAPLVAAAGAHTPSGSWPAASPGGSSARASANPASTYASAPGGSSAAPTRAASTGPAAGTSPDAQVVPITEILDPDMYNPQNVPAAPAGIPPSGSSGTAAAAPTSATGTGTGSAASGSATNTPGTSATGSSAPTGSSTSTGSTSGSAAGTSSGSASSSGTTGSSPPSSSAPPATSSTPSSDTASAAAPGSTGSVGRSTSSAASGTVVRFVKHRRTRRRYGLDRLGAR